MSNESEFPTPMQRTAGVTSAERYLKTLCDRTFLSFWSYPGVYRDQGVLGETGHGKEICDLLVVFQEHIIIFSDKNCNFPDTGNLQLDWSRWYKKAVKEAAEQIWGAERWIKTFPNRIFVDRACTRPFPLAFPDNVSAKFHRIVVAHGASDRCKRELGGSGSLMISSDVIGDIHASSLAHGGRPFEIGQVDPPHGYVHVLDDTSLDILLQTLDTVGDFVAYLTKKENFIQSGRSLLVTGEEELLAFYLTNVNDKGEHDFIVAPDIRAVCITEGLWEDFRVSAQRQTQLAADKISYFWDDLIERFSGHILGGTLLHTSSPDYKDQDITLRWLAREGRTRRRFLSELFLDLIITTKPKQRGTRIIEPSRPGDPYFVFLVIPPYEDIPFASSYEEYREVRKALLTAACRVTKIRYPNANDIVGIAMESGDGSPKSEDLTYLDGRIWSKEDHTEAYTLQRELGLLTHTTRHADKVLDYPIERFHTKPDPGRNPRNKPCHCGSGKKYKRCCGR